MSVYLSEPLAEEPPCTSSVIFLLLPHPRVHAEKPHTNCISVLSIEGPLVCLTADISEILSVKPLF